MLEAARRARSDQELSDRELVWRTLLWDGAPSRLVEWLARQDRALCELDGPVIAGMVAEGVLSNLEDALELTRLAVEDQARRRALKAVNSNGAEPLKLMFLAEPGLVSVMVRPDLRQVESFGLTPYEARHTILRLTRAANQADELSRRRS